MKKGFTLIELLAVILILGVIALIAVPVITNIIHDVEENSAKVNSSNYVRLIEDDISKKLMTGQEIVDGIYNTNYFDVELKGEKPLDNSCVIVTNQLVTGYVMHYEKITVRKNDDNIEITEYNDGITCSGTFIYNPVNTIRRWDYIGYGETDFHVPEYKEKIKTVTFKLSKDVPINSAASWDVSAANDGSVMAYVILRDDSYYDLFIGSNGGVLANIFSAYIFYGFSILEEVNFTYFNTSAARYMNDMFRDCTSIESLDLRTFDTSNVTQISAMFLNCKKLKNLDISTFDMSNIVDVSSMFFNCYVLESTNLNFENWNTENFSNISQMFSDCRTIEKFDLSKWNTENVTTMWGMFWGCNSAKEYNFTNFNTSNVVSMYRLFGWNNSLETLSISSFNTIDVTTYAEMFYQTPHLISLTTGENFIISEEANVNRMFNNSGISQIN